jgi:hypothetical protein
MSNTFKNAIIITLFVVTYLNSYSVGLLSGLHNNILYKYDQFFFLIFFICILHVFKKNNILYLSIAIRIVFFAIFLLLYFFIEVFLINSYLYSIGDSGGWLRHHIYYDIDYIFQWYEVLFWNFIFSLHYPLYIFIFFKPFVNHLDKSIKKIKENEK